MTMAEIPVKRSGFEFFIAPGAFDPSRAYLTPTSVSINVFEAFNMTVTSCDAVGNRIDIGGHGGKFSLRVAEDNTTVPFNEVDDGNGIYWLETKFTTAGVYNLEIYYDGLILANSPVTCVVSELCSAGTYEEKQGSKSWCLSCEAGKYNNQSGATACLKCSSEKGKLACCDL